MGRILFSPLLNPLLRHPELIEGGGGSPLHVNSGSSVTLVFFDSTLSSRSRRRSPFCRSI